jgi:hypothetical protein
MRRLLTALVLLGVAMTPGCAWLVGHDSLPDLPAPFTLENKTVSRASGGVRVEGTFLGVGERIVTARNMIGRIARVANPYGEDSLVFRLEVENDNKDPVILLPHQATLSIDGGAGRPARTLADYRKRWPSWAVTSDDEGEDQGAAYRHVVDTLLIERIVRSRQRADGRVAFPRVVAKSTVTMTLPLQEGFVKRNLELTWKVLCSRVACSPLS